MGSEIKNIYGLIGKNIAYSFSKEYFTKKFEDSGDTDTRYMNFDIPVISELPLVLNENME